MPQLSGKSSSSSLPPAMDLSSATWRESREEVLGLKETESKSRGPLKDYSIARILSLGVTKGDSSPAEVRGRETLPAAPRHSMDRLQGRSELMKLDTASFSPAAFRPVHPRPSPASYFPSTADDPLLFQNISPLRLLHRENYGHRPPLVSPADFTRFGMKSRTFSDWDSPKSLFFRRGESESGNGYDVFSVRTGFSDDYFLRPQDFTLNHPFGSSARTMTPPPKLSPTGPEWKSSPSFQDREQDCRHCSGAESPMPVLKPAVVPSRIKEISDGDDVDEDGSHCSSHNEKVAGNAARGQDGESWITDESSLSDRTDLKRRYSNENEIEDSFPMKWKDDFSFGQRIVKEETPSPEFPSDESSLTATTAEINNNIKTPQLEESKMAVEGTRDGEEFASRLVKPSAEESTPRRKRIRTSFSQTQLHAMEALFCRSHYPDVEIRTQLGCEVGLDETKIQIWFQNRRAKWRKVHKLSRFGGLQDITASDYVPAPTTAVASSDMTRRHVDHSKFPLPPAMDHFLPFPPSALNSIRPLTSAPMDSLTSRVHPGMFDPPLAHGVPLPSAPYPDPRVPGPVFFPSLLMCQTFETMGTMFGRVQGSRRQIGRVSRSDLDLDQVKDVPRSRSETASEVTVHDV